MTECLWRVSLAFFLLPNIVLPCKVWISPLHPHAHSNFEPIRFWSIDISLLKKCAEFKLLKRREKGKKKCRYGFEAEVDENKGPNDTEFNPVQMKTKASILTRPKECRSLLPALKIRDNVLRTAYSLGLLLHLLLQIASAAAASAIGSDLWLGNLPTLSLHFCYFPVQKSRCLSIKTIRFLLQIKQLSCPVANSLISLIRVLPKVYVPIGFCSDFFMITPNRNRIYSFCHIFSSSFTNWSFLHVIWLWIRVVFLPLFVVFVGAFVRAERFALNCFAAKIWLSWLP